MDSETLSQIQSIIRQEMGHVAEAVRGLSTDIRELDNRMRTLELQTSTVLVRLQEQTTQLAQKQADLKTEINNIALRLEAQVKLMHQSETNILEIVSGVYVSKEAFADWKLQNEQDEADCWKSHDKTYNEDKLAQETINTTNRNIRALIWVTFTIALSMIANLIWQIYLAGGIANYAEGLR